MSKYKLFYFSILFLIITLSPQVIYGTTIEVNIAEILDSTIKEIDCCNLTNNLMFAKYDILNSGSLAYAAKIRFDIFNGSEKISTIWSEDYRLNPGGRETIDLYWYHKTKNALNIKAKLYRAYDIIDIGNITWEFNGSANSKEPQKIDIVKIHTYDNVIEFKIKTLNDTKKVIVYPKKSPEGWIFKQNVVENIKAGKLKSTFISYETGVFTEKEITLIAVSEDGQNYGEKSFLLKKESNLAKWFNGVIDIFNFN